MSKNGPRGAVQALSSCRIFRCKRMSDAVSMLRRDVPTKGSWRTQMNNMAGQLDAQGIVIRCAATACLSVDCSALGHDGGGGKMPEQCSAACLRRSRAQK